MRIQRLGFTPLLNLSLLVRFKSSGMIDILGITNTLYFTTVCVEKKLFLVISPIVGRPRPLVKGGDLPGGPQSTDG